GLGAGFELDPPPRVDRGELVPVAAAELLRVAPLDLLDSCQPRSGRALAGRLDRAGEQEPLGQVELVDQLPRDVSVIRGWRVVAGGGGGGSVTPWGGFVDAPPPGGRVGQSGAPLGGRRPGGCAQRAPEAGWDGG